MVSRTPPRRSSQADSASVVVAVERLTHNVLRCLSDVVQHRAEVPPGEPWGTPGIPWGLRKGLGESSKTGENCGFFSHFSLKHILPTKMGYDLYRAKGWSCWQTMGFTVYDLKPIQIGDAFYSLGFDRQELWFSSAKMVRIQQHSATFRWR